VECELIKKVYEGRPNIADAIANKEINLIINTPLTKQSEFDDSFIRKIAIKNNIPYITATTAAVASAKGIGAYIGNGSSNSSKKSLQEYHREIK
jgi:carbamoyl-phosphate synthase large subunit